MKIITHPGSAHRDEFLACCVLLAKEPDSVIFRREPTAADLADPNVYVVDVGREHDPEKLNFDHHQFPRDAEPACALSLVLQRHGLYDDAKDIYPWLEPTEILDSKGPFAFSAQTGIDRDLLMALMSPIEGQLLRMFGECSSVFPPDESGGSALHEIMEAIGSGLLEYLAKIRTRLSDIATERTLVDMDGMTIVYNTFVDRADDPVLGLELYCKRHVPDAAVTVTQDDRGEGFCLFRRNDDPRVDFSRIEGEDGVVFAHKNGFVAKTTPDANVLHLIRKAIVTERTEA